MSVLHTKYYSSNQIEKYEMGGPCSTYGEDVHTGFGYGHLREREHLEDPGINRVILRWSFRKWDLGQWTGASWLRIGTGGGNL